MKKNEPNNAPKKIVSNQPCTLPIKGVYENACRNTLIFLGMIEFATDETLKQPWKRAGVNLDYGRALSEKIQKTKDGEIWNWTLDEVIELYYCMDICCKFYVSDVGERVRNELKLKSNNTTADYEKEKTFTIGSCENIMRDIKIAMKSYPRFNKALSVLEKLVIVPFENDLLTRLINDRVKGKELN